MLFCKLFSPHGLGKSGQGARAMNIAFIQTWHDQKSSGV